VTSLVKQFCWQEETMVKDQAGEKVLFSEWNRSSIFNHQFAS